MSAWTEPQAAARGAVIVIGGRGESAAVYGRLSRRLAFDGYRVAVVAPVGDEQDSGLERGDAELEAETRSLLAEADAALPRVLVGSDTGASLAARLAAGPLEISGVVLAGLPSGDAADAPADWEAELEARSACPVHRGVLAAEGSLLAGRLGAPIVPIATDALAAIAVPVLAIHGDADVISPVADALARLGSLPAADVVLVAGGRHDILNDLSHRSVAAEIAQFLERLRLPGAPRIIRRVAAAELEGALGRV